jgi:hypothetical protein
MIAFEVAQLGPPLSPVLCRLLGFWIVFAVAMSIGTKNGYPIGDLHDPECPGRSGECAGAR